METIVSDLTYTDMIFALMGHYKNGGGFNIRISLEQIHLSEISEFGDGDGTINLYIYKRSAPYLECDINTLVGRYYALSKLHFDGTPQDLKLDFDYVTDIYIYADLGRSPQPIVVDKIDYYNSLLICKKNDKNLWDIHLYMLDKPVNGPDEPIGDQVHKAKKEISGNVIKVDFGKQ